MADQQDPARQQGDDGAHAPAQDAGPSRGKKGRRYAGQAYDLGAGANVAGAPAPPQSASPALGQTPAGQPVYGYPQSQSPAQPAYPQQQLTQYGQPAYGQPAPNDPAAAQPSYGQPAYGQQGYQAPAQGYSVQDPTAGVTQQFGQMNMQQQPQPQGSTAPVPLTRLQTTDLISQPFHVSEIDMPPPPIVLPPNVRPRSSFSGIS